MAFSALDRNANVTNCEHCEYVFDLFFRNGLTNTEVFSTILGHRHLEIPAAP